jgi:hypothetical protein
MIIIEIIREFREKHPMLIILFYFIFTCLFVGSVYFHDPFEEFDRKNPSHLIGKTMLWIGIIGLLIVGFLLPPADPEDTINFYR